MRNIVKGGMLIIVISLFMAFIQSSESTWLIDINKAQEIAKEKDNVILMSFQGSDWCANCKRLEKILFSNADFLEFSNSNLVLLKVDFPMKKENKLSKEQTSHNETLAEEFNPDGQFPKVIILDSDRKTLGQINYEPGKTAEDYIAKIQKIINE